MASIAAGHPLTAAAGAEVLRAGGNAFDAALAAMCAACVAEPVLASLGGGGFLLARPRGGATQVFDFFAQTPRQRRADGQLDFYPILADFGDATQEFHIGLGAIATPGAIAGLFAIHRRLCQLPVRDILAPAARLAREGVVINAVQHGIAQIVAPILRANPAALALYADTHQADQLAPIGTRVRSLQLADAFDALAEHGPELFYRGDWAQQLARDCRVGGGHLTAEDLAGYQVRIRPALMHRYRGADIYTNPPPSLGGFLLGITLSLLERIELARLGHGTGRHRHVLALAQDVTQRLRLEQATVLDTLNGELDPDILARYHRLIDGAAVFSRGTTQISVADSAGNLASLTLSNGEGAGYVLPGTGIMLNNMLGEEDINPHGFHRWPTDQRIRSMMAPTLLSLQDGRWLVTGSSGSNRIRSAILQVISNVVDFGLDIEQAVAAPRVHCEQGVLSVEPPVPASTAAELARHWPNLRIWSRASVFFGGAHSVAVAADGHTTGAGDPRRGGVALEV